MIELGANGLALESDSHTLLSALALSAGSRRAFRWAGFRRDNDGVREHEAAYIRFFSEMCGTSVSVGKPGGEMVELDPGMPAAGAYEFAVPGAEPALPFLRAALVALARARGGSSVVVHGSTHARENETFEVTSWTWAGMLKPLGLELAMELRRAGFVPRGRGEIEAHIAGGTRWRGADWSSRGDLDAIQIISAGASVPAHVQQRQAARARSGVAISGIVPSVQLLKLPAKSSGSALAVAGSFGGLRITMTAVSERGKSAEEAGQEASTALRRYAQQPAVVPELLVDSLLPFLAFADGASTLTTPRLVPRADASVQLVRAFTSRKVSVDVQPGGVTTITIGA